MKKIIKDTIALFIITLVAGLMLGGVYLITKDPIDKQNEKIKQKAYKSVFSTLDHTEEMDADTLKIAQNSIDNENYKGVIVNEIVKVFDADNNYLGLIVTVTDANGYGGNIKMTVGIDKTSTITGLEFLEINETPGLGMNANEKSFKKQFKDMKADKVQHTKNEKTESNEFDAISSATITSKAVEGGVNGALISFRAVGGAE